MAKEIKDNDFVCEKCGGTELEEKEWVDFYTQEVLDGTGDYDEGDRWCRTCEEHVDFITLKQFKEK
jgi:hypothetical protein